MSIIVTYQSAIVTGCSRGIGRAVTAMLLAEGWEVFGISRTMPAPFPDGDRFSWVGWDLGRSDAVAARPANTLRGLQGEIDALVHCAGIRGPFGPFEGNDPDAWARTIATNLLGTERILRVSLPLLRRAPDPRILLFSGGGAFNAEPGYSAYACSKAATVALADTLAEELAGQVAVNCVAPGFVATNIHAGTPHATRSDGGEAMGRAVACVRHLLSPATHGLTGRTVSAQYDDWPNLSPLTVPRVMDSQAGRRTRHKITMLEDAVRHPRGLLACPVGTTA